MIRPTDRSRIEPEKITEALLRARVYRVRPGNSEEMTRQEKARLAATMTNDAQAAFGE